MVSCRQQLHASGLEGRPWACAGLHRQCMMGGQGLGEAAQSGRHLSAHARPPLLSALYRYITERVTMPSSLSPARATPPLLGSQLGAAAPNQR
jgi:hypothetical protein